MTETAAIPFPAASAPNPRRVATRARICEAASQLFFDQGFALVTMEHIAQAADIRRSTLYLHFREKDEILAAIARDYTAKVREVVARLPGPAPTREEIEHWVGEFAEFVMGERAATELLVSLSHLAKAPAAALAFGDALKGMMAEQLTAFRQALEPGQHVAFARAMFAMDNLGWALCYHARAGSDPVTRARLAVAAETLNRLVRGENDMADLIQPFRIDIPQADLDDLQDRLRRIRWPQEIGDNGQWQAGTSLAYMRELVDYWLNRYDWRMQEAAMNALPQFRTGIDGVPVHFVHVQGKGVEGGPAPMPLIINHGWPWTFWDMRKIIGPLTDPAAHGGDPADAFEVIAPSLPGFAFSSPLEVEGMFFNPTADLWVKLMARLGHDRFATQGGDVGAYVSARLGHKYAERVIGVHLHLAGPAMPPYPTAEDYAPDELAWGAKFAKFMADGSAYMQVQRTRPQTIAFAMHDSPVGLAAWLIDKRRAWSDCGGDVEAVFSKDDLITTAMLYWLTDTYGSSAHHYYAAKPERLAPCHDRQPPVEAPTALLQFKGDVWLQPRKWAERYYNLKRWNVAEKGGHFAPMEQPEVLVDDIREFFRTLRG